MGNGPPITLPPGRACAISGVELAVLEIGPGPSVSLRIGLPGRCERRLTLRIGERATVGGVTLGLGPGTTADRAEILLG